MLTPRFELSQTADEVIIVIHAPYANIKDTEVYVDDTDFRFYSAPYYLRLNLPGKIVENDHSSGSYECEKGDFTLKFSKVHKGEDFPNLDMITTLLAPPKKRGHGHPTIEVISNPIVSLNESTSNPSDVTDGCQEDDKDGNQWLIDQTFPSENIPAPFAPPTYGFGGTKSGALASFEATWTGDFIDLSVPDLTPVTERAALKEKHESEQFSEDHYMADLIQDEYVRPHIEFRPDWETLRATEIVLDGEDKDLLKELPNKEYLLTENQVEKILFGMVDILFASCYDYRTTLGDSTVESAWTINKLSSTLSWFQEFDSMEQVVTACLRRSLCYPLYRNWELSMKVLEDVKTVLSLGRKCIIKRFCEIHRLFNNSYEPRYILNQLYIKDYLIWLQQVSPSLIASLGETLSSISPSKSQMGLDLVELEAAAWSVHDDDLVIENAIHEMVDQVDDLAIDDGRENPRKGIASPLIDSDSDDSESDSDSSSSSSSSSSESSLDSDDIEEAE